MVDEAVVQRDNSFYMDHNVKGQQDVNGAIFLDAFISLDTRPYALILYGHNMRTGARFGSLRNFDNISFYRKYPFIDFSSIYEEGSYIIFSVGSVSTEENDPNFLDFFGLTYPQGTVTIETVDKLKAFGLNFNTFNPLALLVGAISLAILIVWPKISEKIPGSLIAVIAGVLIVKFSGMKVNTIGDLYTINSSLPTLHVPAISFGAVKAALPDGFTIAVLAAIESLLSCVVADSMINSHHRSNMELIAQGCGNIGSALFGGIPATGAIARTAANIKNGGRTPVAGMVHSLVLVLVLVVLMPYAALIPMPTIAAILFIVAYNMCQWRTFVHLCKTAPKSDILVLTITFVLTVVFDLVLAIEVGMLLAMLLFLKRMSEESGVVSWKYYDPDEDPDGMNLKPLPPQVRVYEIFGPMFFGSSSQIDTMNFRDETKVIIIRMRGVPALDATAMHSLESFYDRCQTKGIQLVFSHVNEQPLNTMQKDGFVEKVGEENFRSHIDDAIEWAKTLL